MKPPETRSAKTAEWNIAYQVLGSGPRVGLRKRSSSERGSEDAVLEQVEEKLRAIKPRIGTLTPEDVGDEDRKENLRRAAAG